jgi:hypothetical protein
VIFHESKFGDGQQWTIILRKCYIIITNVFTTLQNITVIGRKVTESQCETERET